MSEMYESVLQVQHIGSNVWHTFSKGPLRGLQIRLYKLKFQFEPLSAISNLTGNEF